MGKTPKEIISWCIWKHNNQMTGQNTQTQIDKIMDKEVYPKALAQLEEYYKPKKDIACKYSVISHGIGIGGEVEEVLVHCKMNPENDYKEKVKLEE